jgi:hypothetical protein
MNRSHDMRDIQAHCLQYLIGGWHMNEGFSDCWRAHVSNKSIVTATIEWQSLPSLPNGFRIWVQAPCIVLS